MKQTEKTEKKRQLTDAELQQVTGGGKDEFEQQDCRAQHDQENCEQRHYCDWVQGNKDGHYHCTWVSGS